MPTPARALSALISRATLASTSRAGLGSPSRVRPRAARTPAAPAASAAPAGSRSLSFLPRPPPLPFFAPGTYSPVPPKPAAPSGDEREVDDREWEMRVARAMLHLRDTLPRFFDGTSMGELFPPDIYSRDVVLKLPAPIPVKAYSMTFGIARNGMQALHSDLHTHLERMSFSPLPPSYPMARRTTSRNRQIRVQVAIHGSPRLPPHKTSSLYSFCPRTGLVAAHEVEAVRPLPGEGVAEWLLHHLLGRQHAPEPQAAPCRSVAVPVRSQALRRRRGE